MAKKQGNKIVRVQFSEDHVKMFGNSYKPWEMQFDEYLWLLKQEGEIPDIEKVTISDNEWVSWGGLKWCSEERFQHLLNREGCQDSEPDNQNPRQYKEMTFYKDANTTRKVNKAVSNYKQGIY
ncbi:spore protein H [Bacillus pseudomycoides]|uniref:spore protein H n=1 Tax=Bacillus pseudomycoides TaxID=64104 RepID=UPI003CED025B